MLQYHDKNCQYLYSDYIFNISIEYRTSKYIHFVNFQQQNKIYISKIYDTIHML